MVEGLLSESGKAVIGGSGIGGAADWRIRWLPPFEYQAWVLDVNGPLLSVSALPVHAFGVFLLREGAHDGRRHELRHVAVPAMRVADH